MTTVDLDRRVAAFAGVEGVTYQLVSQIAPPSV